MPYHVETRFVREEGKCGGLYGAQVGQVEEEELQRAGGARVRTADRGDRDVGIGLGAPGDVDCCRFGVETLWWLGAGLRGGGRGRYLAELEPNARGATSD